MWYSGNFRMPERVTVAEGSAWPEVDSEGHVMHVRHHHDTWADAKTAILVEHNAGRKLRTRDVIECENRLAMAREELAGQCKELLAAESLTEPED